MLSNVLVATLQSAFLTLLSTLIARTFTGSDPPIVPLIVLALLNTPPNYYWQQLIERFFPGYTATKIEVDDGGKGVEVEKTLNLQNTVIKFTLDQTVGAVWNVACFLGLTRFLQGVPIGECFRVIREVRKTMHTIQEHSGDVATSMTGIESADQTIGYMVTHGRRIQAVASCLPPTTYPNSF